tara:strand:+ start:113 stop:385 length:273 start_codon:yes stop_codon:yes gene_type:complete
MFFVCVVLDFFRCVYLDWFDLVHVLAAKFWEASLMVLDLLKCFGLGVLIICAMCCGPLLLRVHVQQLELEQHRLMQELDGEDVRLPELRP